MRWDPCLWDISRGSSWIRCTLREVRDSQSWCSISAGDPVQPIPVFRPILILRLSNAIDMPNISIYPSIHGAAVGSEATSDPGTLAAIALRTDLATLASSILRLRLRLGEQISLG